MTTHLLRRVTAAPAGRRSETPSLLQEALEAVHVLVGGMKNRKFFLIHARKTSSRWLVAFLLVYMTVSTTHTTGLDCVRGLPALICVYAT